MTMQQLFGSDIRDVPLFEESIGGALIDAARISAMAAHREFANEKPPAIILPDQEPEPTVAECIEQALNWLDLARMTTIAESDQPITSLHRVNP